MSKSKKDSSDTFETVEPIGKRVVIRKDEDKKETKGGIQLPDNIEIPTITGRIGEWLLIGGVTEQLEQAQSGIGNTTSSQSSGNTSIWIKADIVQ